MAKKDFKSAIRTQNIENVVKNYITVDAAKTDANPKKQTALKTKNNKNKTVSFRLTEQQYNKLIEQAEKNGCNSISEYIVKLLDR